jgi:mycofactocin system glycosyltransferase
VRALHEDSGGSWLARYETARSSLDLGPTAAAVRPHSRVSYVPSATVLMRVSALSNGFDEQKPVAEDVDAIWRLCGAGWRVRYEPAAVVRHDHRTVPEEWLGRRMFYGTGAALLAERHGSAVAPMVLAPWAAALAVVVLAQRRWSAPAAAALCLAATARNARLLRGTESPVQTAGTVTLIGVVSVAHQAAAALTRHYWPLTLPAALFSRRARRALIVAALAQGVADHRRTRPQLDVVRYVVALRLDDLAYGAGLWRGAIQGRSPRALVPLLRSAPTNPNSESRPPTTREGSTHAEERLVRDGR